MYSTEKLKQAISFREKAEKVESEIQKLVLAVKILEDVEEICNVKEIPENDREELVCWILETYFSSGDKEMTNIFRINWGLTTEKVLV